MVISKKTIVLSLALVAIICIVMTTTEAHTESGANDKDHKSCVAGTCKTGSDDEPFNPVVNLVVVEDVVRVEIKRFFALEK
ncbi:hypothetical protein Bca52824_003603 [Brassica carinata]|uniref:Uncharacterized protein n=1 Tax=Brassica carinata TaxID=52824 RepID=A0A8X8BFE1_BRACI|nr:hypothetical protein Bca52824_003603 [Brassica carinata]